MIEQLESRTLLSLTPAHAALNQLRAEVGGIGQLINGLIAVDKAAISNLTNDVSIFPDSLRVIDYADLRQLNFQFNSHIATLQADFEVIKTLFNQDITQLINRTNAYNRHPSNSVGVVVQASEELITAQGNSAASTFDGDSSQLQAAYLQALALVSKAHPLDATFINRTNHIAGVVVSSVQALQATASTVALTDIPNFITALEPNGVISSGTA